MSRLIVSIYEAVETGKGLKDLAAVAGMTGDAFVTAFKDRPAEAIASVVAGLKRISDAGGNVFGVLGKIGVEGVVMTNVTLSASQAADGMAAALRLGNEAFAENNAHLKEAGVRFETAESRIQRFNNSLWALKTLIGDELKDRLADRADQLRVFATSLVDVSRGNMEAVGSMTQFASVLGAGLMVAGALTAAISGLAIAFPELGIPVAGTVAAVVAFVGVFAAATYALHEWGSRWLKIPENLALVNSAMSAAGEWISETWNWISGVFGGAVNWIGGMLDRFVAWGQSNWGQIVNIFSLAKDNLVLIGGMLWEGMALYFNQLWNFLSRFFEEIGQAFKNWAGFSADQTVTFLDVLEGLLKKSKAFLYDVSVVFNAFTDFIYWLWPVLQEVMEVGVELFVQPLAYLVDYVAWAVAKVTGLLAGIAGFFGGGGLSGNFNVSGPQGLATGGVVTGSGWAMVGERGPELVRLPKGSTVYDSKQTAAATNHGGTTINMTNNFYGQNNPAQLSRDLTQQLRLELGGRGL